VSYLRILYCHQCVPGEEADDGADDRADDKNEGVRVSHTAVAQLASFCLLALQSEALQGAALEGLSQRPKTEPKSWPHPYEEAEELLEVEDMDTSQSESSPQATAASLYGDRSKTRPVVREFSLRSRTTCRNTAVVRRRDEDEDEDEDDTSRAPTRVLGMTSANKRKEGSSSGSSENDDHGMSSDSDSPPARRYCTQACLLGLKRGWDLDENCPNASSHRTVEGGRRHPINASEFASLVGERLHQNPDRDCVALDP